MSIFRDTNILINEVKMNDVELLKPNSTTGEERIDILLKRIEDGETIELDKGGVMTVDKDASKAFVDVLKKGDRTAVRNFIKNGPKYLDIMIDTDGDAHKLTALKKAPYFGGGAGAKSATAETTAAQEATQAMIIALSNRLNRDLTIEDLTVENLQKVTSDYDVETPVDKAIPFIEDKQWSMSLINTANELRKKLSTKGMVIHHASPWVKSLEKVFNQANKDETGARIFSGKDKWNPSDIWAVRKGVEVKRDINDLVELKAWIQEMFERKDVYGISLKKTPKNTRVKTYNFDGDVDDLLTTTIKDLLVSKKNKLFSSKGAFVMFEGIIPLRDVLEERSNELEIRSFKTNTDINAEIKGRYAAGGKIGFGPMNSLLKRMGLPQLTHRKVIGKLLNKKLKDDAYEHGEKVDRVAYYKKIFNKIIAMAKIVSPEIAKEARRDVKEISADLRFNEFAAKYQAVELVSNLKQAPEEQQRDFIQRVIQYASSRDELSSVFTKVW